VSDDPADSSRAALGYPIGVERALVRAAAEPAFLDDLKARRAVAAQEAGIDLTPSERAVLEAISEQQLEAAVALLVDRVIVDPLPPQGIELSAGLRGDRALILGIRPDHDVTRGIRPGLPVAVAAGAIVVGGAGALLLVSAGNHADLPPDPAAASAASVTAAGGADQPLAGRGGDDSQDAASPQPNRTDAAAPDASDEDVDAAKVEHRPR